MNKNEELVRLEQFVDSLLNKYNELKANFHSLEATLARRDEEITELKADLAELRDERSEVGTRVSGLLGRIEQWEAEQGEDGSEAAAEEDAQGSLFGTEMSENS